LYDFLILELLREEYYERHPELKDELPGLWFLNCNNPTIHNYKLSKPRHDIYFRFRNFINKDITIFFVFSNFCWRSLFYQFFIKLYCKVK
jgi:hypothetical protein